MDMKMKTTGEKIKELRLENHLTQKQLGEKCGMYESQIRKYETGSVNPKFETLQKIATALHVSTLSLKSDSDLHLERLMSTLDLDIIVQEKTEEEFINLLYKVGFTVTKANANTYQVLSNRFNWNFTISKNELDKLEKSIMDFTLYTSEKFFSNYLDDCIHEPHGKNIP